MADSDEDFLKSLSGSAPKPSAKPTAAKPKPSTKDAPLPGLPGPFPVSAKVIAPLVPVFSGAQRAAGTGVNKIFDLLNRPDAASLAGARRGPMAAVSTFIHGESPEQNQADVSEITRQLMLASPQEYAKLPGWRRSLNEFATQRVTDPTTYVGGAGILEHLAEAGGAKSLPKLYRAIEAMQNSKSQTVRNVGTALANVHDFANFKGGTLRALGQRGAQGLTQFRGLKSINNTRRVHALDLGRQLTHDYHDVIAGLNPEQEGELYAAVHTGSVSSLPPDLQMRAAAFKQVTDNLAYLSGDKDLRVRMLASGYVPPKNIARLDTSIRDLQDAGQYRKNYVPTAHDFRRFMESEQARGGITAADERALTPGEQSLENILRNPTEPREPPTREMSSFDPALRERGDAAQLLKPAEQRKVIEARLHGGAQAIAARDAERSVAELFGVKDFSKVPPEAQEFFRETVDKPGGAAIWKQMIDVPKVGLFALPFRHIANIASLAYMADPSLQNLYGTSSRFAKLMLAGMDAEKRAKILGPAYKYGVSGVPSIDRKAAGWIGNVPGIGQLYKLSNHTLWSFDDAAKASVFSRKLARYKRAGMTEKEAAYRAADETGAELIDYSNRSPLTKALAYVAPFATYRSKVPGAVTRAVTRHPERVLAAGRASPELVGDLQQAGVNDKGEPQVGKSYLPLAEVLRGTENPWEFARATAGYPFQMLASKLGLHGDDYPNYFTYGKKPGLKYLTNAVVGAFPGGEAGIAALPNLPIAGPAATRVGIGPQFKDQGDLSGAIRGQTGFGLTSAPRADQQEAAIEAQQLQHAIDDSRARGDAKSAQFFEQRLKTFLEYHHLYEK